MSTWEGRKWADRRSVGRSGRRARSGLVALLIVLGLIAIAPAAASATIRYTTPTGTGSCTETDPCSLDVALAWSGPGDEVRLAADEYRRTSQLVISTPNLTISGPPGRYSPADFRAFLIFETEAEGAPSGFDDQVKIRVLRDGLKLERLSVSGTAGTEILINSLLNDAMELRRVAVFDDQSFGSVVGQDVVIENSVIRQSGGTFAAEVTGAITGSTITSTGGIAISNSDAYHDPDPPYFDYCDLQILNTIAVGATGNLVTNNGGSACEPDTSFNYSWIPRFPGFGGDGIIDPGLFTVAGPDNIPDSPPALSSPFTGDFNLALDSPAINTGCGGSCGIEDFYGRPRPIGAGNDIGATETILPPSISAIRVDSVESTRAELSAPVNPNGGATFWNFQQRVAGTTEWETFQGGVTDEGASETIVRGTAQPLDQLTTYEVRLVGVNDSGVESFSPAITTLRTPGVGIVSARARVTAGKVTVKAKIRTSGAGRVDLRATTGRAGSRTWCQTGRRVTGAGVHAVNCQLGRKGRKKLRKGPLRLTLRATYSSGSRGIGAAERRLTIPRRR